MNKRLHLIVSGRVQGVSFRWHTQEAARRLGLAGWVRNLADGRVEVCFEGESAAVAALAEWCRTGPAGARVDGLESREEPYLGEFTGFRIRF